MLMDEIKALQKEFDALPRRKKYSLGGKGVELLNKIHRLQCKLSNEILKDLKEGKS